MNKVINLFFIILLFYYFVLLIIEKHLNLLIKSFFIFSIVIL